MKRALTIWHRVAARSEQAVPVQAIDFKPATATLPNRLLIVDERGAEDVVAWEDSDSVRYFQDLAEGRNWQLGWLGGEINKLTHLRDKILTENNQPETPGLRAG